MPWVTCSSGNAPKIFPSFFPTSLQGYNRVFKMVSFLANSSMVVRALCWQTEIMGNLLMGTSKSSASQTVWFVDSCNKVMFTCELSSPVAHVYQLDQVLSLLKRHAYPVINLQKIWLCVPEMFCFPLFLKGNCANCTHQSLFTGLGGYLLTYYVRKVL